MEPVGSVVEGLSVCVNVCNAIYRLIDTAKQNKINLRLFSQEIKGVEFLLRDLQETAGSERLPISSAACNAIGALHASLEEARRAVLKIAKMGRLVALVRSADVALQLQNMSAEISRALAQLAVPQLQATFKIHEDIHIVSNSLMELRFQQIDQTERLKQLHNALACPTDDRQATLGRLNSFIVKEHNGKAMTQEELTAELRGLQEALNEAKDNKARMEEMLLEQMVGLVQQMHIMDISRQGSSSSPSQSFTDGSTTDRSLSSSLRMNPPNGFLCPICQDIMTDPVSIETGISFDRHCINRWFERSTICPVTRQPVENIHKLLKNVSLRQIIQDWHDERGITWEPVLDVNRCSVSYSISVQNCSSLWCHNHPDRWYYECKILKVQYLPARNLLRLYFDARGEYDLRPAHTSSLALVLPVEPGSQLGPMHVLAWFFPGNSKLCCKKPRHQKGYLEFASVEQMIKTALRTLPQKPSLGHPTVQLAFVYAHCSYTNIDPHCVRSMWKPQCRDYTPAAFLPFPPETFSLYRLFDQYPERKVEPEEGPWDELVSESDRVQQERWAGVPRVMAQRDWGGTWRTLWHKLWR